MKTGMRNIFLERVGIDSDSLLVHYTFASGEGDVIWNDLYTKDEHYCNSNLLADKFPGLSIGYTDTPSTLISGSGYFTYDDVVKIGSGITSPDWTAFVNFGKDSCVISDGIKNKPRLLLSSMGGPSSVSGFNLGVNDVNRLFIEYNNQGNIETRTLNGELANFNLISLSHNSSLKEFNLSHHDFANSAVNELSFNSENYNHSNEWYLGGSYNENNNYTGYSGYIDDFLFFNEPVALKIREDFSQAFFVDDIIPAGTVTTSGYLDIPSEPVVNTTGIVGTGVTGYECGPLMTVGQKQGDDITLYANQGLTGVTTGTTIEWGASGSGLFPILSTSPEQIIYLEDSYKYGKEYISFFNNVDSEDFYEIYTFNNPKTNLNKISDFQASTDTALLNETYKSGENINLYANGLIQNSGDSYDYRVDQLNILSEGYYKSSDFMSYDKISGESYVSGYTGTLTNDYVVDSELVDRDIYLNGQKLVSGLDYSSTSTTVNLYPELPEGEISFSTRAKNIRSVITGNSTEKIKTYSIDELVWLNGVKQKENEDYFRINECSLFDPSKKVKKQTNLMYNKEMHYGFGFTEFVETDYYEVDGAVIPTSLHLIDGVVKRGYWTTAEEPFLNIE